LFGLAERIVAVESCVYLAAQLAELRPHLLAALEGEDEGGRALLDSLVPDAREIILELRRPVYYSAAIRALQLEPALGLMSKVGLGLLESVFFKSKI
jgi:hypothetical protein